MDNNSLKMGFKPVLKLEVLRGRRCNMSTEFRFGGETLCRPTLASMSAEMPFGNKSTKINAAPCDVIETKSLTFCAYHRAMTCLVDCE
jgi:hypothetical protein